MSPWQGESQQAMVVSVLLLQGLFQMPVWFKQVAVLFPGAYGGGTRRFCMQEVLWRMCWVVRVLGDVFVCVHVALQCEQHCQGFGMCVCVAVSICR